MDSASFEEIRVPSKNILKLKFLKEGQPVNVIKFQNKVIDVELPTTGEFIVVSIDETTHLAGGYKGSNWI